MSYTGAISLKSCCLSEAASAVRAPGAPGRRGSEEEEDKDEDEEAAATATWVLLSAEEEGLEGPAVRRYWEGEAAARRSETGEASGGMAFRN